MEIAPVKVGEEYTVKIINVGKRGDGVAKIEGFVVFIPKARKGEEVKVKITKVLRNFAFAEKV